MPDHLLPRAFRSRLGWDVGHGLRGLLRDVPVWLVPGEDPTVGRWLSLRLFPQQRVSRVRQELDAVTQSP